MFRVRWHVSYHVSLDVSMHVSKKCGGGQWRSPESAGGAHHPGQDVLPYGVTVGSPLYSPKS